MPNSLCHVALDYVNVVADHATARNYVQTVHNISIV